MEIRQIRPGDYEYVKANAIQDSVKDYPDDLVIPADSWTCVYSGVIVAVGGIKLLLPGVGEVWIILTRQFCNDKIFAMVACRAIKKKMEELIENLNLRRCEAQTRADFPKGIRFIETLGFSDPYVRKRYNLDGSNMILYSRVFGD